LREVRVREQSVVVCCTGLNHHIWKYETFDHYMSPKTSKLRIAEEHYASIMSACSESDISGAITAFQSGKFTSIRGWCAAAFRVPHQTLQHDDIASLGVFRRSRAHENRQILSSGEEKASYDGLRD
jgi:hypothetical protein